MVSLCDTHFVIPMHWGNFNKFAKFVKMARVQRVNPLKPEGILRKFQKVI
jgi:hypothetical protein